MAAVTDATTDTFRELVSEGTVLVDVWGPACVPCVALAPHVEQIAENRLDLSVVKLEAPKARRTCIELRVMTMPTFLLFRDGEEVARISDPELSPTKLHEWLDESLETSPEEVS